MTSSATRPAATTTATQPRQAVATARAQVADLLGARPEQIVFTGCGSEANTQAICGVTAGRTGHVITQATEHPAVLQTCRALTAHGIRVTVLPVDEHGLVRPTDLAGALTDDTVLVSVMYANNETGTIQPIAELAALTHDAGALFHTDAAQTTGKLPYSVDDIGVDLLTVAGHKFGGPKGVGALYLREGVTVQPVIRGGGQEHGLRSGTENVAAIAGVGAAAEHASTTLAASHAHLTAMRDLLHRLLVEALGQRVLLNGHPQRRLPNTLNISITATIGAQLLATIPQIAASTGSACHDGSVSSPVLTAMGLDPARVAAAIRLSVGLTTTEADIQYAADLLATAAGAVSSPVS
ncbi:cysteine desulfurase family protein [Dactylosporangium sp. NPDC000555]|uniref:cysteine desulfurase family protein n=1 Tax=Dactylosporangium sp. NPDC000555 TaxID=3154260 RepID=UPI003316B5EA